MDPKNADHWVATGDGGDGHHDRSRPDVQRSHAADRPDVSRRRRQPGAVLDLQQPAGRRHDARAEQLAGAGPERAVVFTGAGRRRTRRPRRTWRWRRPWRRAEPVRRGSQGIGGCESGFTLPDLADPDIIWASCYGNEVTRYDARTGRARSVSPWIHTLDSEPTKIEVPLSLDAAARDRSVRSPRPSTTAAR